MKKRILSLVSAFVMLFSLAAVSAGAVDIDCAGTDSVEKAAELQAITGSQVTFNGHVYKRVEDSMDWFAAKKYCEEQGGHLATITSAEENEIVTRLVKGGTKAQYWLGGTDEAKEGTWVWVTGEPWTFWGPKVTFNNFQNNEHYLQMERHHWGNTSKCGVWNDINYQNWIKGEESFFSTSNIGLILEFDINGSIWAQPELAQADALGLIPASLAGKDMTKPVTRAEFAAVSVKLYETLTGKTAPVVSTPFTDIKGNADIESIAKAYGLNIAVGISDTKFAPNNQITREELATMLCRVVKKYTFEDWSIATDNQYYLDTSGVKAYADDAYISAWAKPSVYYLTKMGIFKGVEDGTRFAPKAVTAAQQASGYATATREQAIALSKRVYDLSPVLEP
ncbi:MAG: S-layer homology domain-containing protein [Eubacteriales bacterium]|nr:S-layer homology domain-containing protein [Eubacteriales bacterium]